MQLSVLGELRVENSIPFFTEILTRKVKDGTRDLEHGLSQRDMLNMLQAKAVECGLGLGTLPCFVGDALPGVVRIPGCEPYSLYELWMLTHPDLRDTARHRVFRDFIADLFTRRREKLGGIPA